jgi:hypothetical protein
MIGDCRFGLDNQRARVAFELSRDPKNKPVSRLLDLGLIDLLEGKRYAWGDDFRPNGKYQHLILDFAA